MSKPTPVKTEDRISSITKASKKERGEEQISNTYLRAGYDYSKVGNKKDLMSMAESETVARNIKMRGSTNPVVRMARVNEEGEVIPDTFMEYNGQTYFTNSRGYFTTLDGDTLRERQRVRQQQEETTNQLISLVADSPEDLAACLGISEDRLESYVGAGKPSLARAKEIGMPEVLRAVDAHPLYLRVLPSNSKELNMGLAKLRVLISMNTPMVKFSTGTTSLLDQEKEKI